MTPTERTKRKSRIGDAAYILHAGARGQAVVQAVQDGGLVLCRESNVRGVARRAGGEHPAAGEIGRGTGAEPRPRRYVAFDDVLVGERHEQDADRPVAAITSAELAAGACPLRAGLP